MSNAQRRRKCKKKGLFFFISILFYVDLVCFGPFGTAILKLRVRSSDKKTEFKRENGTNRQKKRRFIQGFQNRTGPRGQTVKTENRDENRFFKPEEPDFLLIP